jgi:DNA invertase Pin-like site-specific DNA recombinase
MDDSDPNRTGRTVIYARVSTADQDLDHQTENLWEHATGDLGIDPDCIDVLADESTGTNTDRSGYRELMERVRTGDVERVVVREVTRIGRNFRDISETVHEIVEDHDIGLTIVNDGLAIEPGEELSMQDKMFLMMFAWGAELEAEKLRQNTIAGLRAAEAAGKWTTRPPYGFTTDDDGYLVPDETFDNAVAAIYAVEALGWSHRKAARHSGVPRRTVPSVLDRREQYIPEGGLAAASSDADVASVLGEESMESTPSELENVNERLGRLEERVSSLDN